MSKKRTKKEDDKLSKKLDSYFQPKKDAKNYAITDMFPPQQDKAEKSPCSKSNKEAPKKAQKKGKQTTKSVENKEPKPKPAKANLSPKKQRKSSKIIEDDESSNFNPQKAKKNKDDDEFEISEGLLEEIQHEQRDLEEQDKKPEKSRTKSKKEPRKKRSSSNSQSRSRSQNKKKAKGDSEENVIKGPLFGETIVLTGKMDFDRDQITNLLKSLGAKVTGSVSGKTTLVVHGQELEDGRAYTEGRKYKEAAKRGVKTLSASEFEEYVADKVGDKQWTFHKGISGKPETGIDIGKKEDITRENSNSARNLSSKIRPSELWADKYAPKTLDDLVGNRGQIQKFIAWLDDWNDVVLKGQKKSTKPVFQRGSKPQFENLNARACLITGDPGIGKTSSVRLIAKLKGYKTMETNASDKRNKESINTTVSVLQNNLTLFGGELQQKNLIVMDEVDGMSGNDDRGGIAAVIELIKKTKNPIVCIANDRQSPKLRSLANHCYDLKFAKPDKRQVVLRMIQICKAEGIECEPNALENLCESFGNDIRQCLGFLQIYSLTHKKIKFSDISNKKLGKDETVMLTNFDAAARLLRSQSKNLPYKQLLDMFFIDYSLIPLLIQENYLHTFNTGNFRTRTEELEKLSLASDLISYGDTLDNKIYSTMDWRLLSDKGLISSCMICKLNSGSVIFPKFPEILGKMSTTNKLKRELLELKNSFRCQTMDEIRMATLPIIYLQIIDKIVENSSEEALNIMKKYRLTMDMFKENIIDLVGDRLAKQYENLGREDKSNLTRLYNKNMGSSIIRARNKKGKATSVVNKVTAYDEFGNPLNAGEDEPEEDNEKTEEIVELNIKPRKTRGKTKTNKTKKTNKTAKTKKGKGKKGKSESSSFIDDESMSYD